MIVRITGWRPGLRKVSLTQAIQGAAGLGLKDAKQLTDRILVGESIEIDAQNLIHAQTLVEELQELGADAEIVGEPA